MFLSLVTGLFFCFAKWPSPLEGMEPPAQKTYTYRQSTSGSAFLFGAAEGKRLSLHEGMKLLIYYIINLQNA